MLRRRNMLPQSNGFSFLESCQWLELEWPARRHLRYKERQAYNPWTLLQKHDLAIRGWKLFPILINYCRAKPSWAPQLLRCVWPVGTVAAIGGVRHFERCSYHSQAPSLFPGRQLCRGSGLAGGLCGLSIWVMPQTQRTKRRKWHAQIISVGSLGEGWWRQLTALEKTKALEPLFLHDPSPMFDTVCPLAGTVYIANSQKIISRQLRFKSGSWCRRIAWRFFTGGHLEIINIINPRATSSMKNPNIMKLLSQLMGFSVYRYWVSGPAMQEVWQVLKATAKEALPISLPLPLFESPSHW